MALFTGVQHLSTFNVVTPPLFTTFCQISVSIFVDVMYWPPYGMDKVHLLCCTGSLAVVLSLWWRDHNHTDSYRVSKVDVQESPIASGARVPWQQQRCDSLHCHEEWWGSLPQSASSSPWKHCVLQPGTDSEGGQGARAPPVRSYDHYNFLRSSWRYWNKKFLP